MYCRKTGAIKRGKSASLRRIVKALEALNRAKKGSGYAKATASQVARLQQGYGGQAADFTDELVERMAKRWQA
jgi:hypothetical protein